MNKVSKLPTSLVLVLLGLVLLAKAVGVVVFWFLPLEGREPMKHYSFTPDFIRVDLAKAMGIKAKKAQRNASKKAQEAQSLQISSMVLKGFYGNDKKGYAIISKKGESKVTIVSVGESFEGYKLKSIGIDGVIFTKGGKEFELKLQQKKNTNTKVHYQRVPSVVSEDALHLVEKMDVEYFASNPREIWKNISIDEVRRNGTIDGFKVRWIRKGSKFAALGLKKGDIIIKANNKRLKSYKDAIDIYRKIDKLDAVSIVVLRNGEEKELVYEINR